MIHTNSREEWIIRQARARPASERAAFLDGACAGDVALRQRLQTLFAEHEQPDTLRAAQANRRDELHESPTLDQGLTELGPPLDEAVGQTLGRYKLLEKVGEGGCGVVYVAEQTAPVRRRVALKVIKLGMDTKQVVARFEAERQALAMMDHPNIAKVLDAGTTEAGRPFFVMELVRGIRITEYCDQNHLTTRERLDLFIKVCQAIQHAHQKGIIHRDIKPSNILVTMHDGVPVPKVIDFGIAKATEGRLTDNTVYTQLHQFIGTPAYMSPEQAEISGLDIDTRSDIYSLGVLLYELLAGSTPFDAQELMASGIDAMRKTIREKEPVRPSTRLATLPGEALTTTAKRRSADTSKLLHQLRGDLDWIVMKCLEKDRTRRYETANGLAFDLKRHLNNEPVLARPPSAAYKLHKAIRRNKLAFGAGAAVVAALVAGLSLAAIGWRETRVERDSALQARAGEEAQRKAAQRAQESETSIRREVEHDLYAAKMNLAQLAWDQNNIGRLRQLLAETQDSPYRGFEWYYWQPKTHLAGMILRGHLDAVFSVAFSPDGQRIVTGSIDDTGKVWEAASGKELLTLKGHSAGIMSVAFSPDGQQVATGSLDGTAKVWDTASGKELFTLRGRSAAVFVGGFNEDPVNSTHFSPDGHRIAAGINDGTVKVWEAAGGKELFTLRGHNGGVNSVAFSPDGQRLVTGSDDDTARVWEAATGEELLTRKGHSSPVQSVAFSADGGRIATGSLDGTAKVWEAASGKERLTFKGHSRGVFSAAFSPDGQWIVTGSLDGTAKVWEAASGKELLAFKGHSGGILSAAFSSDGRRIITGSADRTAAVWDVANGLSADKTGGNLLTLQGHGGWIGSAAVSPDGKRIVTGSSDKTAKVWEAASGKDLLTLAGHSGWIVSLTFSPDGKRIVTGSVDKTAKVWEVASGREVLTLTGHSATIRSVAFSPDGQWIATGSDDKTAKVCEAASGRELLTLMGHSAAISSVAFSPDGKRIVTGSSDKTAKVWEAASGKDLLTITGHSNGIHSADFSPDGNRIVTTSGDKTAKVWEATSGNELLTLTGHSSYILAAAFSPDGQRIVTASEDATAKVWEAASGRELLTLMGHSAIIGSVAFSPDGQRIVTGSGDGTAKVWEAATKEQVAQWQAEELTNVIAR